ncbi:3-oxoacyl-ACP reductase [Bacillus xiamenensis]|uniref:3-oxoacyl-ACP reductase n=1 Tax=Bacillus xiamenensis TaxID=1178537 RepID=A0AAC9NCB9_9BACI|nr:MULTISPECIES: SDR family oxidoreductase [Bacillus]AOZ88660.1 3-oxoacyl-ACP reductase [Bacillus xiamenensis]MBG9911654.1 3-oxoacyl-ACP reductase [Bacillus xiamenensis]MCY9577180.1 SDR family oxidoreductase [Bacillus xiamenensis]QGX64106.1 SDR family NAD(P)-dependent oxidoreductase [Bacillus sp. ms-22]
MAHDERLKGKTILITGASKGIGQKTALLLENEGANLVLGSRNYQEKRRQNVLELPLDVRDEQSVQQFAARAIHEFGCIDVLINSAGLGVFDSILDTSIEAFDQMISTNLRGSFLMSKCIGKHMVERKNGHIINLVSVAGTTALPNCGGYSSSKFGLLGLTKVMQAEWRKHGVQVTAIIPGAVSSDFWENIEPKPDLDAMIPTETVAAYLLGLIAQPPGAYVDEITIMPPLGIL